MKKLRYNNIFKYILLLIILFAFAVHSFAQKRMVQGYLRDSITKIPMNNAIVTNENTHQVVFTNDKGFFSITAARNDMIYFDAFNYRFDTLVVNKVLPDTIIVYLSKEPEQLPGVTVTTKGYNKYQLDSIQRRMTFIADAGPKKPEVSRANSMGAGIGINLDAIFSKRASDRRKAYKSFERSERWAYINYRFSPELVARYTGLEGDSLALFIRNYTPSYEWLRAHPGEEDLVYYINDKLKSFLHRRE